jgi:hypothetical protein
MMADDQCLERERHGHCQNCTPEEMLAKGGKELTLHGDIPAVRCGWGTLAMAEATAGFTTIQDKQKALADAAKPLARAEGIGTCAHGRKSSGEQDLENATASRIRQQRPGAFGVSDQYWAQGPSGTRPDQRKFTGQVVNIGGKTIHITE